MKRTWMSVAMLAALSLSGCSSSNDPPAAAPSSEPAPSSAPAAAAPPTQAPAAGPSGDFGQMAEQGALEQVQDRPKEAAALAAGLNDVTGEPTSAVQAQQFANVVCLAADTSPSLDAAKASLVQDSGQPAETMSKAVDLAVAYRCPELASK